MADVTAIVVAAGSGQRMGGVDKAFLPLDGRPLIAYPLHVFQSCAAVQSIVLVLQAASLQRGRDLVEQEGLSKVAGVYRGGTTRSDSVRAGLAQAPPCEVVLVHDGARPCLDAETVLRGLEAVRETGAAVAAIPIYDTVKRVDSRGRVRETPSREGLWVAQTPQVFRRELLEQAYSIAQGSVSDDAALVEALGYPVTLFRGSPANIKVTTPEDLALAAAILARR